MLTLRQTSLPLKRQLQSAVSFQMSDLFFSDVPAPFQPPMYSWSACSASLGSLASSPFLPAWASGRRAVGRRIRRGRAKRLIASGLTQELTSSVTTDSFYFISRADRVFVP